MRKNIFPALLVSITTLIGQASGSEPAQRLLEAINESSRAPGVSAAVSRDGVVIWSGAAGVARDNPSTPVTDESQFRIASVSKLFAATLALALAEKGIIDLDANIRRYVPEWPDNDGAVITIRQLAAHISGVSHYSGADYAPTPTAYTSLSEAIAVYAHKPLLFSPGANYEYSSYGYALMGAALERASGKSFATLLEEIITAPHSLDKTFIEDPSQLPTNATALYLQGGAPASRNDQRHVAGASALLSTPIDLVTFAHAYAAGAIVNPALVEMSWTPARLRNGTPVDAGRFQVGFGWRLSNNWEGEPVAHHAGTTPGARSILSYNRRRNSAAAFLSNAQWTSRMEDTVELIATAAIEGGKLLASACPAGEWVADGTFNPAADGAAPAQTAGGILNVSSNGGVCEGELIPNEALKVWLRSLNDQQDALRLVLVAQRGDDLVFAAATPWGAFHLNWRDKSEAPTLIGNFAGRDLELRLRKTARD